jgi:transcriptional regulator with XRE-family HTH domain
MNVTEWLLDSDPSIRWQVMRDLTGEPDEVVAAERSRVASEGWGARLLALQGPDGQWGRDALPPTGEGFPDFATRRLIRELHGISIERLAGYLDVDIGALDTWENRQPDPEGERSDKYRTAVEWMMSSLGTFSPAWTSTMWSLMLLRDFGLDPESEGARRAVGLVRENSRWEHDGQPFFEGEVEPCINGRTVAIGVYFGEDVQGIVDRLLGEQMDDGGWNCEQENGSRRGSFNTTICVLEGLLAHERATGDSVEVSEARRRGQEYLLERRMLRRLSTGEVVDPAWALFSFPTRWHYDVLRGLDYLRSARAEPDERISKAIELVRRNRGADGRWPLQNPHPGYVHFAIDEGEGEPSRWNTLRALRVLEWAGEDG